MAKKRLIRKCFRDAFYKYIQPGRGTYKTWTMRFGNEGREYVVNKIKILLSWTTSEDVSMLSDKDVFSRLLSQYGRIVRHYKGEDYYEFIMWKFGEIDLD